MPDSSPRTLALALATAVAAAGLWFGASPALGAPADDCGALQGAIAAARQKAGPEEVADLQRQYDQCRAQGTTRPTTAEPAPGDPSGSKPPPVPGSGSPGHGGNHGGAHGGDHGGDHPGSTTPGDSDSGHAGDDKACSDFMSQAEAQRYYDGLSAADPERRFLDRDHDGRACASLADVGGKRSDLPAKVDPGAEVDQDADDGSTATTSGSQVKDVPEGSVDTGNVA